MSAELPFLEADQPWRRATMIVAGRPTGSDTEEWIEVAVNVATSDEITEASTGRP
jgi:hypothetical protein